MIRVIETYELSPLQAGMLFHAVSGGDPGVDIMQVVATLREPFNEAHFLRAWRRVVERHPILRSRFRWEGVAQPVQEVLDQAEIPVERFDWHGLAETECRERFQALLDLHRVRGIDLSQAPLMRLALVRATEREHRVLWTYHHAVLDGRSRLLVLREVFAFYEAYARGGDADLPLPRPYRDYIEWLPKLDYDSAKVYWQGALAGFRAPTPLMVARDREAEQVAGGVCGVHEIRLPGALTTTLRERARAASVTINNLLQGAWALLLHRYSGERDIVFGATRACRRSALGGADDMIGMFINTLPIRVSIDPEAELVPWLRQLRSQQVALRDHEHTPLIKVQGWSDVPRGTPLFESILVFENQTLDARLRALGGAWSGRRFLVRGQGNFPLVLNAWGDDELVLQLDYSRRRFEDGVAARMLGHLRTLLEGMAAHPEARLRDLPLLTEGERHQLLVEWNGTHTDRPADGLLHDLVAAQAARTPNAAAVVSGGRTLTYRELNRRANQLAHALRKRGVGPDVLVGLYVNRTPDMIVALLGVLKAGGAYIPLDSEYPTERLAFMLKDCGARVLITEESLRSSLPPLPAESTVISLDGDAAALAAESHERPQWQVDASNLAYAIYTSGTTGQPKAASLTHRGLGNLAESEFRLFGITPQSRVLQFASLSVDTSLSEVAMALCSGATLYLEGRDTLPLGTDLERYLEREKITVLSLTPSALAALDPTAGPSVEQVIVGGEPCPTELAKRWAGRCRFFNAYGPTETTVTATCVEYRDGAQPPLIGRPLPNVRVYLLDTALQPVPVGVSGELYIGGVGVGRGYLGRPQLNAERFVPDPFRDGSGAVMYRTGDFARWRSDGHIEFIGRMDDQVKIRGFRIELGEIESALNQHPGVKESVVVAREDAPGGKRLVAYVVPIRASPALVRDLRDLLKERLPGYMVPAAFVLLEAFPLTPNGKLDRKALQAPVIYGDPGQSYTAPRTPAESAIAQIWGAVLGVDRVGIHDHFFELGGDSILSIQVIARCRQAGLQLTPRDLFKRPTIAQLAQACAQAPIEVPPPQELLAGTVQLTPIQRWFLEEDTAERHHWNQAFLFELPADVDLTMLEQALHCLLRHHDALRLRFRQAGKEWVQEYAPDSALPAISRVDLAAIAADKRAAAVEEHAARVQSSLNLEDGCLLRAVHFAFGAGERGRMLLVIHHLAVDGISWRLIREDLESAYSNLKAGKRPVLAPKTTSYQAWAARLADFACSATLRRSLSFWIAEANRPVSALPAQRNDCENLEGDARPVKTRLTVEDTSALLQRVPTAYRTQVNDVLLTALARALQRWTDGEAFRIDLEGHGREDLFDDVDVSRTVGWFTTVFPVRLELQAGLDEGRALKSVKEQLRRIPDRGLSYGLLRYASDDGETRAALSPSPRPALLFNYLGQFDQVVAGSQLFSFAAESTGPWHSPASRRTHALEVLCLVRAGELEVEWKYHPGIHGRDVIERVAQDFLLALRAIIAHCLCAGVGGRTPSDFPLAALTQDALDKLCSRYPGLEDVYPLSPMQRLFHVMESTRADLESEPWHFRVEGAIDAALLRTSIERVVARHSILRTAFVSEESTEPLQVVLRQVSLPWSEEDWRGMPDAEQDAHLAAFMQSERRAGFDLAQAPLMRVALRRVGDEAYHLVWNMHHLCVDGWSWPLVFREVSTIYEALRRGSEPELGPQCAYRSYVAWLHEAAPDSEAFWKETLGGIGTPTPLNLASPPSGPQARASRFAEETVHLDHDTTAALQSLARSQHVTLSTIMQGAWSLLLSHYSGLRDVVFGAAFSGRPAEAPGIESLIGPCVTNLPVRVTVTPEASLARWLSSLQRRQLELWQHQYAPLEQIQTWAQVPWRYRLFDSLIVFQNYQIDEAARRIGGDARLVPIAMRDATHYPLTVMVTPQVKLRLLLIYQPDRFTAGVVRTYATDLAAMLQAIAERPGQELAQLLARLPAASRGKAAAFAATQAPQPRVSYVAPSTETEHEVASLWQDLFGVERVSLDENFFDLGGHSLLLLQAHSRLRATLRPDLPVVALLRYPTIRTLARHLSGAAESSLAPAAARERAQKQREALFLQRSIKRQR
jgi:amino acid adenylation domain-containing protein/non-ribosomal peptide synthase protein (TIGR01720 family)